MAADENEYREDTALVTVLRQDLADALRGPRIGTPQMDRLTDAILYGTDEHGAILNRAGRPRRTPVFKREA